MEPRRDSRGDDLLDDDIDQENRGDEVGDAASKKAAIRKRTKTGCLTCRKRRIKCDEGRPTCNNCIKSKRPCEGYNQRVIWKEPVGPYAGLPYGSYPYPGPSPQALHREQQHAAAQQRIPSQPLLAPKPSLGPFPHVGLPPHLQFHHQGEPTVPGMTNAASGLPGYSYPQEHFNAPILLPESAEAYAQSQWNNLINNDNNNNNVASVSNSSRNGSVDDIHRRMSQARQWQEQNGHNVNNGDIDDKEVEHFVTVEPLRDWDFDDYRQDELMGDSDDEALDQSLMQLRGPQASRFVSHMVRNPHDPHGLLPRYFMPSSTAMATYDPEPSQSPLNDEQIRAVFSHFVRVTGPSISLYERHATDPGVWPGGEGLIRSQRHIWASTFPILSFSHPALLQAILAMASLQISRLEGTQPIAALKHYHLAVRRIARNVGRTTRRAQPANLAATLLLAYWEVWNSDHEKWCKHLLGARWIMKDIPFSSMTRAVLERRLRERHVRDQMRAEAQLNGYADFIDDGEPEFLHSEWDQINMPLLRIISGRNISYFEAGSMVVEQSFSDFPRQPVTDKDIETYETLSDMYWWYCKMDTYQSILGGQKLFMDYEKWLACPPRAPMGRLDAVYGTFDHLIALLARMSHFSSHDIPRKKKALSMSTHGPKAPPPGSFPGMVPTSGNVPLPAGFSPQRESTPPEEETELSFDAQTAAAHEEWADIRKAFEVFKNALGPEFAPLSADEYPPLHTPFGPSIHYSTYAVAGIWLNYYMGLIMLYRAHPTMPPIAMMAAGLQAPQTGEFAHLIGRIAIGLEEDTTNIQVVSTLSAAGLIESAFPLFVASVQYREEAQRHWLIRRLNDIARLTGWNSARQIAMGAESAWQRAFELKRGPEYIREPEMAKVLPPSRVRRLDVRISEIDGGDTPDGKKGRIKEVETPHYAMGLLMVEQDFEKLELGEGKGRGNGEEQE